MIDLMAWNADSTRMPYKMHAEYLEKLYLHNELAAGSFMVVGRAAALQNIRAPDVRCRHRARSRRTLALGLQNPSTDR